MVKVNDIIKIALKVYIKQNKLRYDNYIFKSIKCLNQFITVTQIYRIFKDAAASIDIQNLGIHLLRKIWGYWTYRASKNMKLIILIMVEKMKI